MRTRLVLTLLCASFGVACSNSSNAPGSGARGDAAASPDAPGAVSDAGAISDAGAKGDAPTEAACTGGPPITSAPAQWMRPSDCGGIGNLCSEGCGGQSECQLIGNVCVPLAGAGGFAGACPQTPYCLAYGCMTYPQASCFCTGDAGAEFSSCACGPSAVAGLCASEGASCKTTPCCACQPLKCMTDSVSGSVCRQSCTKNTDCATACCDTSTGYCHDSLYCNCVDAGAGCDGAGTNCCPGTTCLTFQADGGGPFSCYTNCTKPSDCATGCCSQTIPGLTYGACGPC
jgi:hypothetical protein